MTRFFLWLEQELGFRPISETEAAEKLSELRAACPDYVSDSFHTISAYGKNAAIVSFRFRNRTKTQLLFQPKKKTSHGNTVFNACLTKPFYLYSIFYSLV